MLIEDWCYWLAACATRVEAHDGALTRIEGTHQTVVIEVGSSSCGEFKDANVVGSDSAVEMALS